MNPIRNELTLDTLQNLVLNMPGRSDSARRKLYGAVDVLLVEMAARLEAEKCDNEALYVQLGELLDACHRLAGSGAVPAADPARLAAVLTVLARLRAGLLTYPLAS